MLDPVYLLLTLHVCLSATAGWLAAIPNPDLYDFEYRTYRPSPMAKYDSATLFVYLVSIALAFCLRPWIPVLTAWFTGMALAALLAAHDDSAEARNSTRPYALGVLSGILFWLSVLPGL